MASIKEIGKNIKAAGERGQKLTTAKDVYIVALILAIGLLSFGLGRLSKIYDSREPVRIEMPTSVGADSAGEKRDQTRADPNTSQAAAVNLTETNQTAADDNPAVSPIGGQYVGSRLSDKYHLPWCSGAKQIKEENKIWFASKADAEIRGYKPAANCPGL